MQKKIWLKQIIYSLILFSYIITTLNLASKYHNDFAHSGLIIFLYFFTYLILGLILGSNWLVYHYDKDGSWEINRLQLIFIAFPALFLYLLPFFYYILHLFPSNSFITSLLRSSLTNISGVILGYCLTNSFQKVKKD